MKKQVANRSVSRKIRRKNVHGRNQCVGTCSLVRAHAERLPQRIERQTYSSLSITVRTASVIRQRANLFGPFADPSRRTGAVASGVHRSSNQPNEKAIQPHKSRRQHHEVSIQCCNMGSRCRHSNGLCASLRLDVILVNHRSSHGSGEACYGEEARQDRAAQD